MNGLGLIARHMSHKILVKVYDSLGSGNLSNRAKEQIAAITCTSSSKFTLVCFHQSRNKGASATVGHLQLHLLTHSVLDTRINQLFEAISTAQEYGPLHRQAKKECEITG